MIDFMESERRRSINYPQSSVFMFDFVAWQKMVVNIYCMVVGSMQCLVHYLGLMSCLTKPFDSFCLL